MKRVKLVAEIEVSDRSPLLDDVNVREYLDTILMFPGDGGVIEAQVEEVEKEITNE